MTLLPRRSARVLCAAGLVLLAGCSTAEPATSEAARPTIAPSVSADADQALPPGFDEDDVGTWPVAPGGTDQRVEAVGGTAPDSGTYPIEDVMPSSPDEAALMLTRAGLCTGDIEHADETEKTLTGQEVPVRFVHCEDQGDYTLLVPGVSGVIMDIRASIAAGQADDDIWLLNSGTYLVLAESEARAKELSDVLGGSNEAYPSAE